MKTVAIITARGGSKGLIGKNLRLFAGHPLIAWTISAAKNAKMIDEVIVTTDDPSIREVARRYGARVPRLRDPRFAQDDSPHIDCVLEALTWVNDFTHCCLLQPTSPLRTSDDIDSACLIAAKTRAVSVVSVTETFKHPFIAVDKLFGKLRCPSRIRKYLPRQKVAPGYYINGAIYVNSINHLKRKKSFYDDLLQYYIMPEDRSLQIDNQFDFDLAEFVMIKNIDKMLYDTESVFDGDAYQTDIKL